MKNTKISDIDKKKLLDFLNAGPTAFHAAHTIAHQLEQAGYIQLNEEDAWNIVPKGKYYVQRNHSSVIAFQVPRKNAKVIPAHIVVSHLDSPAMRLKLRGYKSALNTNAVPVEMYGGAIASTWLDRPLGIAGLAVESVNGKICASLYNKKDIAIIPNIAVHFNRDAKDCVKYNVQTQMNAIIGVPNGKKKLHELLGLSENALEDAELNLYDCTPAALIGTAQELVNAPRLDNMLAAFSMLEAMCDAKPHSTDLQVAFFADNEEIGSTTRQGAHSDFLQRIIRRIMFALGNGEEELCRSLAMSYLVSNDAAHAAHPCYMENYDSDYAPQLGMGLVLKRNVSHRYASNGEDNAVFRRICKDAGIAVQSFTNRADRPCGSTVGPCLASALGVRAIDVGIAMLAMHSIRETAAVNDVFASRDAMLAFLTESICL